MKDVKVLVLATRNLGKTRELRELLKDFPVEIKNLSDGNKVTLIAGYNGTDL